MSGSISAALPHPPPPAKPDVADTQVASQLAGLQRAYQSALNDGQSPSSLSGLAKQITDAAKTLGLNVVLPKSEPAQALPIPPPPTSTGAALNLHA